MEQQSLEEPKESERVLAQSKKRALEDSPSKVKNQKEDKVPKTQAFNFSLSNTYIKKGKLEEPKPTTPKKKLVLKVVEIPLFQESSEI
ncbi:hypothetical protein TEQG_08725 [Trichophyton equinum CBS 127.97]|uniref:Uncharacterized protein n=1 Tax=Trichophyton equinum (strain ATCC MYA-4606 / CBS 127.97) TaxID=559882 RepID=F2PX19_TRIEC|nr:hypothetical protein TEQG_08725 [Trichophyton equinum CBS 127.97]